MQLYVVFFLLPRIYLWESEWPLFESLSNSFFAPIIIILITMAITRNGEVYSKTDWIQRLKRYRNYNKTSPLLLVLSISKHLVSWKIWLLLIARARFKKKCFFFLLLWWRADNIYYTWYMYARVYWCWFFTLNIYLQKDYLYLGLCLYRRAVNININFIRKNLSLSLSLCIGFLL